MARVASRHEKKPCRPCPLLARRTRESRQELRRFMRKVKRANPERSCFLEYDRLYVDHKIYVYSEALGQVRGGGILRGSR